MRSCVLVYSAWRIPLQIAAKPSPSRERVSKLTTRHSAPRDAYSTIAATPSRERRHKTHHASINAGQGRQKTTFKSNVVRNLKKDIARMMPFLEAKQASGSPNVALREQAKGRRARKEKVEA